MSSSSILNRIADQLRYAESTCNTVPPVRDHITPEDTASAYAVQQVNVDARVAAGERIVGRKIGLTSLAVQKQLGVDQPDFGALFATMAYGDGQPMPLARLIQPKVEAEIALVLKRDLIHEKHTFADIIGASAYALAAIEVVDRPDPELGHLFRRHSG
jgi:2-keto-4-pentenoate hydratase